MTYDHSHERHLHDMNEDDVTACLASEAAARTIQRIYRGHRARRELRGLDLAPSTGRGVETPPYSLSARTESCSLSKPVTNPETLPQDPPEGTQAPSVDKSLSPARQKWNRAVSVAIQARGDDAPSEASRVISPKQMDLEYFLEMVDSKHRHGSNLRTYHALWKQSPSSQSFFYWLDQGDGREIEAPNVSRERLERQQVRYLSPSERLNYLVSIDKDGLFRWDKTHELVDTDDARFRDSLHGIVPINKNDAPRFSGNSAIQSEPESTSLESSSLEGESVAESNEERLPSTEEDYELKKDVKKFSNVNPAAIYDRFAESLSVKKGMWIFVADSSFRIYVGIKEPGAFQHSSFLRGGRIAAAGLLKIKSGQLRKISPLSGHYRPHVANFRAFHHSLQERGVDLSRVSISYSYAVLAGIEGYTKTKRKMHSMHDKLEKTKGKMHLNHPPLGDSGRKKVI